MCLSTYVNKFLYTSINTQILRRKKKKNKTRDKQYQLAYIIISWVNGSVYIRFNVVVFITEDTFQ